MSIVFAKFQTYLKPYTFVILLLSLALCYFDFDVRAHAHWCYEALFISFNLVPGKPPASLSGVTASSSSIRLTWDDVPSEFQYGIIRGYNIYIKDSSNNVWRHPITTTSRTHDITGLQYWAYYDMKISAFTTPGEGPNSSVVTVRTAQHCKLTSPFF